MPEHAAEDAAWDRYVHPDDLPGAYAAWQAALRSGGPYATEFRVRDAGGTYRWFLVRAMPITGGDGRVVRWFGTCGSEGGGNRIAKPRAADGDGGGAARAPRPPLAA